MGFSFQRTCISISDYDYFLALRSHENGLPDIVRGGGDEEQLSEL